MTTAVWIPKPLYIAWPWLTGVMSVLCYLFVSGVLGPITALLLMAYTAFSCCCRQRSLCRTLGSVGAVLLVLSLGGCVGDSSAIRQANYDTYVTRVESAYNAYLASIEAKPLLDIILPAPDGQEYRVVVNREVEAPRIQQIKDDESLRFWAAVVPSGLNLVTGLGNNWINSYYSYKDNQSMWDALGGGAFGGYQLNAQGDITVTDSLNPLYADINGTGNGLSNTYKGTYNWAEGAGGGGFDTYGSAPYTSSDQFSQAGGEDSNLVQ